MGHQLDSQAPNPLLWDEICVVNYLLLRSSRGVVRGCDHVTGIEVTGESLVAEFTWLGWFSESWNYGHTTPHPHPPTLIAFGLSGTGKEHSQDGEAFGLWLPHKSRASSTHSLYSGKWWIKIGPLLLSSVQWWRCFIFHKTCLIKGRYSTQLRFILQNFGCQVVFGDNTLGLVSSWRELSTGSQWCHCGICSLDAL